MSDERVNLPRVALAAAVAWAVSGPVRLLAIAYFRSEFSPSYPTLFRAAGDVNLPLGFALELMGCFVLAYVYAKGYEGTSGVQEGLRCGVLVGLLLATFAVGWSAVVQPIPGRVVLASVVDALVEMSLYGVVIGSVYRPRRGAPRARRA